MWGFVIKKVIGTVAGRWILGGLVAASLGTAAIMWHNHKEGLKEEGYVECVQEINKETVEALENALAAERLAAAQLRASLAAAVAAGMEAEERRQEAQLHLSALAMEMEAQRNEDPTYREWSDTALPDGVSERLRQAAGSPSGDSDADGS